MHATFSRPERETTLQTDEQMLPSEMRRGPAIYLHTDTGWECVCTDVEKDVWEWLPLLQRIEAVDGVGGVTFNRQTKRWNFSGAIQGHQTLKTRSQPIYPSDPRLGRWKDYDRNFFKCENEGRRYIDPGEQFERLPNGDVLTSSDMVEHHAFLRHLKDAGIVSPMPAVVFRGLRARVAHRHATALRQERQRSTELAAAELKRMDAAWTREAAKSRGQAEPVASQVDTEGGTEGLEGGPPRTAGTPRQPRRAED